MSGHPHLTQKTKPTIVWLSFLTLSLLLFIGLYASLRFGATSYSHHDLLSVLSNPLENNALQDIIIDIRLPRALGAILVGIALALAGAIMQGITRNSIADPGLLGINAGAGLALVLVYAFLPSIHYRTALLASLIGAILATILVFVLAYHPRRGFEPLRLILSGAMLATFLTAVGQGLTIYFNLSTALIGWQAGGLVGTNWSMLQVIAPLILCAFLLAQLFARQLTILSLNEIVAKGLGQRTTLMTLCFLTLVLLLSASAIALVGSIALVGLIIPHLVKSVSGKNYQKILPFSALAGANFLLWADLMSRLVNPPYETPLSSLISIFSLPFFLWLMRKGAFYER